MKVPRLRPRDPNSHKGTYGRVLIVGGSRGMTGAVGLAGMAATRGGAGLVTVAVPDTCLETVASYDPCFMTVPLAADEQGRLVADAAPELSQRAAQSTAIGIGPGLSRSPGVTHVVTHVYKRFAGPMVVDADALNALASRPTRLAGAGGPRIITPHVGEFCRLIGEELAPDACRERAQALAAEQQLIVVLKGHHTLVTDGSHHYENRTGNPGMATGGAGDVLTGVITALLGQGLSPLDAAVLGVHVHGVAGDLACDEVGEISLIATDILEYLPDAFQQLS
jgi:NAD(P)H-hydrate epimerase